MSDSIPERIALELIDRLENITTVNGYIFNVASVDRMTKDSLDGWTPRNLAIAVVQDDELPNDEHTHAGNPAAMAYDVTFNLHGFVRPSDHATETFSSTENAMVAAIKKAVVNNDTSWQTFGGISILADWVTTSPFQSPEGDHRGVTVSLVVTYRISETDPFTPRA